MAVGETADDSTLWDTRRPPRFTLSYQNMGALLGGSHTAPDFDGSKLRILKKIRTYVKLLSRGLQ